jgi:hypothetical protein
MDLPQGARVSYACEWFRKIKGNVETVGKHFLRLRNPSVALSLGDSEHFG